MEKEIVQRLIGDMAFTKWAIGGFITLFAPFIIYLFRYVTGHGKDTTNRIEKNNKELWEAINKFKTDIRREVHDNNDSLFDKIREDGERIIEKLDGLDKGRELNRLEIEKMKGEIITIRELCKRNHEG